MRHLASIAGAAFALAAASSAQAASSDYLLEIEGVKGEAAVASWSFGVCNQGQCSTSTKRTVVSSREASSGMATGKTTPKPRPSSASWDLATMKGARSAAGGVAVAAGDVDGDGRADLAFVGTQPEISSLSLTFQKIEMRAICDGKHIDKATLRSAAGDFEITDAAITCTSPANTSIGGITAGAVAGKQTQGATFGERCVDGTCSADALTDGLLIMRFTSGQMKHTKTGHVTLLK